MKLNEQPDWKEHCALRDAGDPGSSREHDDVKSCKNRTEPAINKFCRYTAAYHRILQPQGPGSAGTLQKQHIK